MPLRRTTQATIESWREALIFKLVLLFASASVSLPWVEDNYAQALAAAKARHVPLFAEVWAPW